jgi:membrane-associated phospholipid phosphatase
VLACRMARQGAAGGHARDQITAIVNELRTADRALYQAITQLPTPVLDRRMRQLSQAANHSAIWLSIAAGLSALGGRAGRRAAIRGTAAIGVTSALVNIGVKSLYNRPRPDRGGLGKPVGRQVPMPSSRSFPSGHSAAGFAFASAVGSELPWLALPLRLLAAAVAYSRVHTGVHYPGDAVAGSLIGVGIGRTVSVLAGRFLPRGDGTGADITCRFRR